MVPVSNSSGTGCVGAGKLEVRKRLPPPPSPPMEVMEGIFQTPDETEMLLQELCNQATNNNVYKAEHIVYELAKIGVSVHELAMVLKQPVDHVWDTYGDIFRRGLNLCRMNVRHQLYHRAMREKSDKALLYLCHNILAMTNPKEFQGDDTKDPVRQTETKVLLQVIKTIKEKHGSDPDANKG